MRRYALGAFAIVPIVYSMTAAHAGCEMDHGQIHGPCLAPEQLETALAQEQSGTVDFKLTNVPPKEAKQILEVMQKLQK